MLRKIALLLLVMPIVLLTSAHAATPEECSSLLKYGWVYDRDSVFLTQDQYHLVQTYFSQNSFHSKQDASQAGGGLGFNLIDILSLNLNGQSSDSNYEQWQNSLLHTTYDEVKNNTQFMHAVQHVSQGLTDALQTCLKQPGLSVVLIPGADFNTFSIEAQNIPSGNDQRANYGSISLRPANQVSCDRRLTHQQIGAGGVIWLCTRKTGAAITASFNSPTLSARTVTLPAHVPSVPTATLTASANQITDRQTVTLTWIASDVNHVDLEPAIGDVNDSGSLQLKPVVDTTYTLTARGEKGASVTKSVTVKVVPAVKLSGIKYWFHTTSDDKDWDTQIGAQLICNGVPVASRFDFNHNHGDHWNNNSDTPQFDLPLGATVYKDDIASCTYRVSTSGSDTWVGIPHITLSYSDGTSVPYSLSERRWKDQHSEDFPLH